MSKFEVNSTRIHEACASMNKNLDNLTNLLDRYYKKMILVPTVTGEWVGNSADMFSKLLEYDQKTEVYPLLYTIKAFINELNYEADMLEKTVRENRL